MYLAESATKSYILCFSLSMYEFTKYIYDKFTFINIISYLLKLGLIDKI